jgi:hypothetical protein
MSDRLKDILPLDKFFTKILQESYGLQSVDKLSLLYFIVI